jgi:hypothetical protein
MTPLPKLLTIDELIHTQTSKIGIIAAEITRAMSSPELATRDNITLLSKKLEAWRVEVPSMLQIPSLTSADPAVVDPYQRRAILMVHVCIHLIFLICMDTDVLADYVSGSFSTVVPSALGRDSRDSAD